MKHTAAIICAAAIFALSSAAQAADPKPAPQENKEKVIAELLAESTAIVKAVDLKKRTVTLETATDKNLVLEVGEQVKKLDQVKVGDTVKTTYYESIAVRPMKVKTAPSTTVEEALVRDKESVKPAGAVGRQVTVVATIDRILDDGNGVTLKGADGTTSDVKVRDPENVAKLRKGEIKVGDSVEITFTKALAISVDKAETPKSK
jgi:hypothetical protein